ncbi:Heterokaryon incompatibility protein [Lasiodiplodia theobromae]|uniref:Heterokaryon incompatibility protein n=1 Tax=Lasiodiplodia theobromae TaxID=45133 RepID=UPI0015C34253|nr:Heterokaryon incompatibility protein [Lasiodiplodia theobromae]KAF4545350.1 Heterokaryon incompatibility protein [Lasiodiplodia theobromae]
MSSTDKMSSKDKISSADKVPSKTDKLIKKGMKWVKKSISGNNKDRPHPQSTESGDPNDTGQGVSPSNSAVQSANNDLESSNEASLTTGLDQEETPRGHTSNRHSQEIQVSTHAASPSMKSSSHPSDSEKDEAPLVASEQPKPTPIEVTEAPSNGSQRSAPVSRTISEMLWDEAYETVQKHHWRIVYWYEKILSRDLSGIYSEDMVIQEDPQARRAQMKELLDTWLGKKEDGGSKGGNEPDEEEEADGSGHGSTLRSIIRDMAEATPIEVVLVLTGACYASETLLHPESTNTQSREALIYVISRMEWYSRLPKLLEDADIDWSTDDYEDDDNHDAESDHDDEKEEVDKSLVKLPLERLLQAAPKERAASEHDDDQFPEDTRELLNDLQVVDPRPGVLNPDSEQRQVMHELCNSLFSTDEYKLFQDWNKPDYQLLWITGGAGQCKTTLFLGVVRVLLGQEHEEDKTQCLSFFFFDYSVPSHDHAAAALKNLIWLLVVQQPSLVHHLREKRETTARKLFDEPTDFFALSGIFFDMIEDENFSKTYFVVDALDECISEERQSGIDDILNLIIRSMKLSDKVRWLVSSDTSLQQHTAFDPRNNLNLADMPDYRKAMDMRICQRVSKLAVTKSYDEDLKSSITNTLLTKSLGGYLWANIVCAALEAEDVWHTEGLIKDIETLEDLESLYHYMEHKVGDPPKNSKFCIDVLQTMALLRQALHVDELKTLMSLPQRVDSTAIINKCFAFLQVNRSVASFRHHSVKEYVRQHDLEWPSIAKRHAELTRQCLRSLSDKLDSTGIPDTWTYASLYWVTHMCETVKALEGWATKQDEEHWLIDEVRKFLKKHFLQWVDHLVARKQLSIVAVKLQNLDLRLQKKLPYWESLHTIIRDSHLFVRLHQRTSGLEGLAASNTILFCPTESSFREPSLIKNAFPWLKNPPKIDREWSHNFTTFEGHTDWIRSIAVSPDGRLVASGSDDSTVCIWDAETGTMQHSLELEAGWVYCVAFSSQGVVAAGSDDYSVTLWHAATGRKLKHLPDLGGTLNALCFSLDGTKLVAASSLAVWLWEAQPDDFDEWAFKLAFREDDSVRSVAFSPDGTKLATGADGGKIRVSDMATCKLLRTFEGHESSVDAVAFSRDGKLLASGASDGTAGIWDANSTTSNREIDGEETWGKERRKHTLNPTVGRVNSISFSPDDEGTLLATATDNAIHIWDTITGERLQVLQSPSSNVRSVAFAPSGEYLVSGSYDSGVHLWYVTGRSTEAAAIDQLPKEDNGERRHREDEVNEMAVSPDGRTVAYAMLGGPVLLWDMEKEEKVPYNMGFDHERDVFSLAFSPSGKLLLSGSADNSARICEVSTGELQHVFEGHSDWVRCAAWCGSEKYIASASDDSSICFWKIGGEKSKKPEQVLENAHGGSYATCVAFCPDGEYLVSGGMDGRVVLWEKNDNGSWEKKSEYSTGSVRSVLVTGKRVVSASADETVWIWDIETGEQTRLPFNSVYYKMWLSPKPDEYIMTSQGALSLTPASGASQPRTWSPWRVKLDTAKDQWWITHEDWNIIFLPRKFCPTSTLVLEGEAEDKVVVGTALGHIHVYRFSKDCTP